MEHLPESLPTGELLPESLPTGELLPESLPTGALLPESLPTGENRRRRAQDRVRKGNVPWSSRRNNRVHPVPLAMENRRLREGAENRGSPEFHREAWITMRGNTAAPVTCSTSRTNRAGEDSTARYRLENIPPALSINSGWGMPSDPRKATG